jgi:hypothetical protein
MLDLDLYLDQIDTTRLQVTLSCCRIIEEKIERHTLSSLEPLLCHISLGDTEVKLPPDHV